MGSGSLPERAPITSEISIAEGKRTSVDVL